MPLEKRPAIPFPRGYVPQGGTPYRVKTNEDWYSVAAAHGVSAQDLIYFNYQTHDPKEVNYYLRVNVGCVLATHDRLNWKFSSEANPGIIYVPLKAGWHRPSFPPAPHPKQPPPKAEHSGIWFGIGAQGGGHLGVAGKDTVEAWMFSLESYRNRFLMNIDGYRLGPGLGGSVGVAIVVGTGSKTPAKFNGMRVSGFDFQASLGGRWGDVAKSAKGLNAVRRIAVVGKFIDKTISFAEWEKIRDMVWNAIKVGQIDTKSEKPEINVIGVPLAGGGAEVSAYYGWGHVLVHSVTLDGD